MATAQTQTFEDEGVSGTPTTITRSSVWLFYLIQFGLQAGEGEGEPHRELFVFDVVFFHEVAETLGHMVEQLEEEREGRSCLTFSSTGFVRLVLLHPPTFVPVP